MNNETLFRRIAAISAIVAAMLILASTVVLSMSVNFNFEFLANPAGLITAELDASAAQLFHWGSILEILGNFLFLIPVMLYLWYWFKPRYSWLVTLCTAFGLTSIVLVVIGSAIRATFWPSLMIVYPEVAEAQRQVLLSIFNAVTDFTFNGLYALDSILAGLWWLGIGLVLRSERRVFGLVTMVLGAAILGAGVGWLFQVYPLARLEGAYFFMPIWLVWLGIVILQTTEKSEPVTEHVMAV